ASETEWCERTLLSRIHSLTLGRLRREIEPVSTQDYLRFLFRWQHVQPGSQLHGAQGLTEVLAQLQGFQCAAASWESDVLPARIARYDRGLLDQLCLSGEIAWGRLASSDEARRAPPGRATPVALVRREDLPWLLDATKGSPEPIGERARLLLAVLEQRGALFLHELRAQVGGGAGFAGVGRSPKGGALADKRELTQALWELVSGGRVTC